MLRSYSPAVAGRMLAPALAVASVLHECRRVLEKNCVPSPGRVVSLLAIPLPRPGTVWQLFIASVSVQLCTARLFCCGSTVNPSFPAPSDRCAGNR